MSNGMSYEQFSRIYATVKDLVKSTSILFDMVDKVVDTPDDLYVEIIMLHNRAVDFIAKYKEMKGEQ